MNSSAGGLTYDCIIESITDDAIECGLPLDAGFDRYEISVLAQNDAGSTQLTCAKPNSCIIKIDDAPTAEKNFDERVEAVENGTRMVTKVIPNAVGTRGGAIFTISGENFGESLTSFGEEGRMSNSQGSYRKRDL